jgi:Spy/CpxP family protein refolding chaperone
MRNRTIVAGLTTALLFLAFSAALAQTPPGKPEPRGMGKRLANFLNLTPEQQARFDEIRKARQEEAKAFREEMGKLRPLLREAMKDPQADQKKIDGLIDQLSQARAAHLKIVVRSFKDMEKVLTPEQLEKFRNARSRMGRRRGFGSGFGRGFGPRRWQHPGWGRRSFLGFGRHLDGWL